MGEARQKRTITVTHCRSVYNGQGARGPYTIYEIKGKDAEGEKIEQSLSSFDDLTGFIGQTREYEVSGPKQTKNGPTYTLYVPKAEVEKSVAERVRFLEEQMRVLEGRVTELYARLDSGATPTATSPRPEPAGARFGDDAPF